jgi:hypothetical protein
VKSLRDVTPLITVERQEAEDGMTYLILTIATPTAPTVIHIAEDPKTGEWVALDADTWAILGRDVDETQLVLSVITPALAF